MKEQYYSHPLILPNKIEYREYQEKIADKTLNRNVLVVLPTGTGKTIIALIAILKWIDKHPKSKAFFLAPTRPLVYQHFSLFKNTLKDSTNLIFLTGEKRPNNRKNMWHRKFIFCTPQLLYNDLIKKYVKISDEDILIFDEAHKAMGNYSYVRIINYLKSRGIYPRILALTASPGDINKTKEIIQNLNIEDIEVYTHEDPLISRYFHGYRVETKFVNKTPILNHIINLVKNTIDKYVQDANRYLKDYGITLDSKKLSFTYIDNVRNQLLENTDGVLDKEEEKRIRTLKKLLYEIILLDKLLTYLESYTYRQAYNFIEQILGVGRNTPRKGLTLRYERNLWDVYQLLKRLVEKGEMHPKTTELITCMKYEEFKRCLIFVSLKETAYELKQLLDREGFPTSVLVGRGSGSKGMKQQLQIKTLEEFSKGGVRILIATHIGEEGLDISEVDLVIFYDNPVSVIRRIQRMGRTGRKQSGKVIFIILKDSRDESKYYAGTRKYQRIVKELKVLKEELKKQPYGTLDMFMDNQSERDEEFFVIVDSREKGNIANILERRGIKILLENIDIGDYVIGNIILERKTTKDFIKSLYEGRLFSQLKELAENKEYDKILVIEGNKKEILINLRPKVAIGTLLTIIRDFKIPIYFSLNEEETAMLIEMIYRKMIENRVKTHRIRLDKKPKKLEEIQIYVLSGIPGIDMKTAKKLLSHFGSLRNIANASVNDLMRVKGIGTELANRIYRVFNHLYDED